MARINNKGFASQLIQNLSLKFVKDTRGAAVAKENPECEYCGSRTSYNFVLTESLIIGVVRAAIRQNHYLLEVRK